MAREDKTRAVDAAHGVVRLAAARSFLEQAELTRDLVSPPGRNGAAVSSAVLAGIAAAVAVCAFAIRRVSAGAHDQAARLLGSVADSDKAVSDLSRLISAKSAAQYASTTIGDRDVVDALNRARRLVEFAERQQRR